jgi:hypothetical protein
VWNGWCLEEVIGILYDCRRLDLPQPLTITWVQLCADGGKQRHQMRTQHTQTGFGTPH